MCKVLLLLALFLRPYKLESAPHRADPAPQGYEIIMRETKHGHDHVWFASPEMAYPAPVGRPLLRAMEKVLGQVTRRSFRLYIDGKFKEEYFFRYRKKS